MATFFLRSFGCRANQAEGEALAAELARRGLARLAAPGPAGAADWIVLQTCTVTAEAEAEARRELRRLRKRHPGARIAVTGCYAERAPAELAALEGVALVAGNREKAGIAARLAGEAGAAAPANLVTLRALPAAMPPEAASRPVVKVQEGCDRRCSFCIVPMVRGASVSRPLGEVLAEIEEHARRGAAEVVLSGINLGQWGRDRGELTLAALVRAALEQTEIRRLRLSSVEPADWTAELTSLLAAQAPRLARHAHLPLQSLSDTVLRRMRRRYRARDAAALLRGIAAAAPGCAIGADVMAGFPGESEAEFAETRARLEELPLAYLHVFPFSPRPGTEAAEKLASGAWRAVPEAAIARRAAELRRLDAALRARFRRAQAGQRLEAVALRGGVALTDNYLEVALPSAAPPGTMATVEVNA